MCYNGVKKREGSEKVKKEATHRNTAQKQLVLEVVKKSYDHPVAEQIYFRAREKAMHISLGTVYRNLAQLSEKGEIRRLSAPKGPDHFDFNLESHYHFVCLHCGEMNDIPKECSPSEENILSPSSAGFDITGYALVYEGICPKCKKKFKKGENINEKDKVLSV